MGDSMLKVKDIMSTEVFVLTEIQSLALVRFLMKLKHIRHIPIVDDNNVFIGLLTHRDLLSHTISLLADPDEREQNELDRQIAIKEVMKRNVLTVEPDMELCEVIPVLLENKYGCLPVVDDKKLVGIITEADFLKLTLSLLQKEGRSVQEV